MVQSHVISTNLYSKEQGGRLTESTTHFIHSREFCVSLLVLLQILFPLQSFRVEKRNFHSRKKLYFSFQYPKLLSPIFGLFHGLTRKLDTLNSSTSNSSPLRVTDSPQKAKGTKTEEPRRIDARSNTTDVDGSP